jgi:hypothetical protein
MREPIQDPNQQDARASRPPEPLRAEPARTDRVGPEPLRYPGPVRVAEAARYRPFGLVEWAPTWGGMFVAVGILLLLSSLGVAIGIGTGATGAAIWGAICVIIAFFVGGWFTGRTLSVPTNLVAGAHGLLTWAVTMVFTLVFALATAIAGIGALSAAARAAFVGYLIGPAGTAPAVSSTAAANTAVTSSWVTFIVLLLSVLAAVIGAVIGARAQTDTEPVTHP